MPGPLGLGEEAGPLRSPLALLRRLLRTGVVGTPPGDEALLRVVTMTGKNLRRAMCVLRRAGSGWAYVVYEDILPRTTSKVLLVFPRSRSLDIKDPGGTHGPQPSTVSALCCRMVAMTSWGGISLLVSMGRGSSRASGERATTLLLGHAASDKGDLDLMPRTPTSPHLHRYLSHSPYSGENALLGEEVWRKGALEHWRAYQVGGEEQQQQPWKRFLFLSPRDVLLVPPDLCICVS